MTCSERKIICRLGRGRGGGGDGRSHIKMMGVLVGNFRKNSLKVTRILFDGRGSIEILLLRGHHF